MEKILGKMRKGDNIMRSFAYVITDKAGIHARPAGTVVKTAQKFASDILIKKGEKEADAKKLMQVMALGAKYGEEITVEVSGDDEETACPVVEAVFREQL